MSGLESEEDFTKFESDPADDIRPIDTAARHQAQEEARRKELAAHNFDNEQNIIHPGDTIDLLAKDPSLRNIAVGAGWEQRSVEQGTIDIDLSCFLLNRDGQTRINEDFVFYNNESACEGAVKLGEDSRTGAGDGDDETAFLDLTGIPFDILKVMFVLSVYDDRHQGHNFSLIRNMYIRLVNKEDNNEIIRLPLTENILGNNMGMLAFCMVREGPKWYAQALAQPVPGGLTAIAASYGIIVQEQVG